MKQIKTVLGVSAALLIVVGGVFAVVVSRPAKVPVSGVFRQADGTPVNDGYYDLRVVGFDTASGSQTIAQDFQDVFVSGGSYELPIELSRFGDTGERYIQICRSENASQTKDGTQQVTEAGCKDPVEQQNVYTYAECPQTITINNAGGIGRLLGEKQASLFSQCVYAAVNDSGGEVPLAPTEATTPSVVTVKGDKGDAGSNGATGERGEKGDKGDTGEQGPTGQAGANGLQGPPGDPATDDQTISFGGASVLAISGGNSVSLASLLDNTDELASLACANGEVPLMTLGLWACGTASGVDTDDQVLSLIANVLSIDNGNSVNLGIYLDNTDSQTLSYVSGTQTLSIAGGNSVNLSSLLDNTDSQNLSLAGTTLSLTGDGTSVSLASFLDNTDVLAALSCGVGQIAKWNGSAWVCAADIDTFLNETQVDLYVANNGYLTSEVDGSVSNELQNLTFAANVLGLTGSGTTFNLSSYLDNTDVLASLSCSNGQVAQWNGSVWVCANAGADTDNQTLSLVANTLSIDSGNSVSLASYLDNTDAQSVALVGNIISISGNASTIDLSPYLDNTDAQTLSLGGNTLSLVNGGSVNLSPYLDNTDAQDLSLAGSTLSLSGDGTTVSLASFLDNTDVLAGLSCSNNQIPKWNGSAWACAADVDTVLNESQVDAYVANNGYLTTEIDGSTTNELQDLTFASNVLGLTSSGVSFDLSAYLDNTDSQDLTLGGNTLSLTGDGTSVSLASYLDNTDSQSISVASNILSISGNASTVDLSTYLDNTDSQAISRVGNTVSITGNASTIDLSAYLDNTDGQTLSFNTGTQVLTISGGNTTDLSSLLDNTDSQDLSLAANILSLTGDGTTVDLSAYLDNTDTLASLSCSNGQLAQWNGSAWVCASATVDTDDQTLTYNTGAYSITILDGNTIDVSELMDNTDAQSISLLGNNLSITGSVGTVDLSAYLDNTDSQDLSLSGDTLLLTGDGTSVDLSAYMDDTTLTETEVDAFVANNGYLTSEVDGSVTNEIQDLSLAANILSLSGDGTTVDLSPYLDNTDSQALSLGGNTLSLVSGGSVDLSPYLDNTDAQDLSLAGSTLSLTGDGTTVSLASFLDNTDVLAGLSCLNNQIPKWNGSAWACAADVDTVLNESQVDAYVANNGYLTTEIDGSVTNELQDLTFASNVIGLTSSGVSFDLSAYLDNTDSQDLSLAGNTLSLVDGGSVSLASYLDNTDSQSISVASDVLSISGNASTVDLSAYLDNTDSQTLSFNTGTQVLTISGGNTADLSTLLDNTDSQDLTLAANILSLTGDGTTVDLSAYLDNTDTLASLSCGNGQIAQWNGSAWVCANLTVDTDDQTLTYNTGAYSITIVDGNTIDVSELMDNTDAQSLSLLGNALSITGSAGTIDLSAYLDNTDAQDLSLSGDTLSLTGDGTSVDLSAYMDDTTLSEAEVDAFVSNNGYLTSEVDGSTSNEIQDLSLAADVLSLTGDGTTVDLSAYLDNTDAQALSLVGNTLSLVSGGSVDLSTYLDNTDSQDLTLAGNILSLTGDGTTVDLSAYLDNTDSQLLFLTIDTPNGTDPSADSTTDTLAFADGAGITITGNSTTDTITIASVLGTAIDSSEITDGTIVFADIASNSCNTGEIIKFNGSAWICGSDNDTTLSEASVEAFIFDGDNSGTLSSGTLALDSLTYSGTLDDANVNDALTISSSGSVDDGALSANVSLLGSSIDSSEITNGTVTGTDLASATILFSNIAQNGCTSNQIMKWNGSAWACASDVDTDTDAQNLFQTINADNGTDPVADSATDTLNFVSGSGVTITGDGTTDTLTIAATLGADITSAEIVDETIVSADIDDGSIANVDLANSSVTVTAGTGLTGGGAVSLGGTVTINLANDFGSSIDSSEITNATILTADIAADQITSALIANGEIVNADIADSTIANAKLVNSAVTVTAGTGLSGGGTVALGGTISLTSALGTAIDTSEITDGTILFADLAVNGCGTGQIIEYNGSAWACGNDDGLTSEVDGSITNELQNLFETISTPSGTSPVADGLTDTLAFANGSGITITGNGATDTITVAATLGVDIDSSEIVDGTVSNTDLANASVTVNTGTGLSGGGSVSLGGTLNLTSTLGTAIDTSEITDSTIVLADFSNFGCGTGDIIEYNGSAWVCAADDVNDADSSATNELQNIFLTIDTPNGTDPSADTTTDTLAFADGAGITITGNSTTDTITIASVLGTSIDSSEISDGTIVFADIASNSCNTDEVFKFNGSAWYCGTDDDTTLNEAQVEAFIFDGDNSGTLSSGTLALGSLSYTGTLGDANIADALTISSSGSVDDGALSANVSLLGSSIDSSEITNGTVTGTDLASATILFSNIAQNGCGSNDIMKWNGSAWACASDEVDDADSSTTNELQNLFATINTDNGTDPVADATADTLNLVSGSGLTITGDGTTDTITIAATLGTTIDSAEIVDGTIVSADIADGTITGTDVSDGTIANADLTNSSTTVTAGTGLTGGGTVSLGGTITLNLANDFGASIDSSEITNGTIVAADVAGNVFIEIGRATAQTDTSTNSTVFVNKTGVSGNLVQLQASAVNEFVVGFDGIISTASVNSASIVDGTVANTDLANSSVTVTAGNGLANGGSVALGGTTTLNIGAGNGITVNADDITVRTAASADGLSSTTSSGSGIEVLATGIALLQGCSDGQVLKWNETTDVWACNNDTDTTLSEAAVEGFIFDGDNVGTLSSGTLALGSLSYTGTLSDANVSDTLTIGATSTVADGALSANVSLLGSSIESGEISDGTIANADLANSSLTVTAGTGLTGGGAVSLGGTVTLNLATDFGSTIDSGEITNGTIVAADVAGNVFIEIGRATAQTDTSTNSTIFVNKTGVSGNLLQLQVAAADEFVVGFDGTVNSASIDAVSVIDGSLTGTDIQDGTIANADLANSSVTVTAGNGLTTGGTVNLGATVTLNIGAGTGLTVNADDIGVTANGLNFTELSDTLSLDASTTISLGANNLTTNLNGTGDYAIQFGGTTVFQILETGAVSIGNALADQAIGIDNGTGVINIATDADANTTNIGTGTAADTVNIGDSNANVALTDAQWSISGAGAANFASVTGAGLADCDQSDDALKWDSATGQFSCGTNRATFHNRLDGNYTNAANSFTDVDNDGDATDDIGFAIGANETWVFEASLQFQSNTTADSNWRVTAPAGATCDISVSNVEQAISVSNLACSGATNSIAIADALVNEVKVSGAVATGATAGNVQLQFSQVATSGTSTIFLGSFITAYRISGADYAEIYYSEDVLQKGMIAELSGAGPGQIKRATTPYSSKQIGIYSTKPGKVIGENDGSGSPIPIALSGRVPIMLSTENGVPKAGDMITVSSAIPGYGMLATRSGYVVGQMLMDAVDNGDGTADGYVFVRNGYWQAPLSLDMSKLASNFNIVTDNQSEGQQGVDSFGDSMVIVTEGVDQSMIDALVSSISNQQTQINSLQESVADLEEYGLIYESLASQLNADDQGIEFLSDVVFSGDIKVMGAATFSADTAGKLTVPTGDTTITHSFTSETQSSPNIVATPNNFIDGAWRIHSVDERGFTIELEYPQPSPVEFTWQSILTE